MTQKIWFKRKVHGAGWTPATWEGWAVVLGYIVALFSYPILSKLGLFEYTTWGFIIHAVILFLVLMRIIYLHGEKLNPK